MSNKRVLELEVCAKPIKKDTTRALSTARDAATSLYKAGSTVTLLPIEGDTF